MIVAEQATVGTAASQLSGSDDSTRGSSLAIRNRHATESIFVGGAGVTTATGFEVLAGESLTLDLSAGSDEVWAVAAADGVPVHVIAAGASA